MSWTFLILGLTGALVLVPRFLRYIQVRKEVKGVPTIHCGVETFEGFFRSVLPHIPFLFPVRQFTLSDPFKKYENAQSDLIAVTQADSTYATYLLGSGSTAAAVFANTAVYHKAESFRHRVVCKFGKSIITAQNGAEHRKHKNVIRACFTETIMREVWEASMNCFDVMMEGCGTTEGGVLMDVQTCMIKFTMNIFGKAGFGEDWPWDTPNTSNGESTLAEALNRFEQSSAAQLLIPLTVLQYSPVNAMRTWGKAQVSLMQHVDDMVAQRRAQGSAEQKDILTALVASLDRVDKAERLAEHEVFSNVFLLLLAGHETSANTLTFLISFLATMPEVQDKMLAEIEATDISYADCHRLKYSLNCIYECLRLRDIVMFNSKEAKQDVHITYHTWKNCPDGSPDPDSVRAQTHLIKAGSRISIDSTGCSMNPLIYPDPKAFKPERWNDPELKHHFTGFALGVRGCIGKRFAEVEMLAFLCRLIKGFRIEAVRWKDETDEAMGKRYMAVQEALTLGSGHWDVRLIPRL